MAQSTTAGLCNITHTELKLTSRTAMEPQDDGNLTKPVAVAACTAMGVFYVAILYFPTLILRLPPPDSYKSFLIRRFMCAAVSSIVSLIFCSFILPIRKLEASNLFGVFGIRVDYTWQALVIPLTLTSFVYTGSFVLKLLSMIKDCNEHSSDGGTLPILVSYFQNIVDWAMISASSVTAWRNYVVAPLTEELVFRACMIPLLLCGGFTTYTAIFLCPIFFSLAHLNHFLELYVQQNYNLLRACTVVGFQLGYTMVFGAYASFLLVRTGSIFAPLIAHVFCNFMALPAIFSRRHGIVTVAFLMGVLAFLWLLFPFTSPHLYNDRTDDCKCWHRYCDWS